MKALLEKPAVKRLLASWQRFTERQGPQHAAAITYFSVLTIIPVLMLFGAVTGFTLTVVRPDWLEVVRSTINEVLGGSQISQSVVATLDRALESWRGLGITALLTASYTGSGWIGNLRVGFCEMLRPQDADSQLQKQGFLKSLIRNLAVFFGLLLCMVVVLAITILGMAFAEQLGVLGGIARILLTVGVSWIMFAFLFLTLPEEKLPVRHWATGALGGAVLVTTLEHFAGLIIGAFSGNPTAAVFGNVIIIMLLLNLVAMIMLVTSSWTGVRQAWEGGEPLTASTDDTPDGSEPSSEEETVHTWAEKRRRERVAARRDLDELRSDNFDPLDVPTPDPNRSVPEDVAARGVKVGMGVGYGVGAATGLGLGAVLTAVVAWLRRR